MLNKNFYLQVVFGFVLLISFTHESWAQRPPSKATAKKPRASRTLKAARHPTLAKPKVKQGEKLRLKNAKTPKASANKGDIGKNRTKAAVKKKSKGTLKGNTKTKNAKKKVKGKSKSSAKKKATKNAKVLSGTKRLMESLRIRLKSKSLLSLVRSVTGKSLKTVQSGIRELVAPGNLRASLMGLSDGVASTVGLVIAASMILEPNMLLLTGLGAMIAGASSMAAGEYSSVSYENEQVRAQQTRLEKALAAGKKGAVRKILKKIGKEAGVKTKRLAEIQKQIMNTPAHLSRYYKELNLNQELASPRGAAVSSFISFLGGAAIPMAPIVLGMTGAPSILIAGGLSAASLGGVGFGLSKMSGNFSWTAAMRMTATATLGAGVSWVAGMFLGGD